MLNAILYNQCVCIAMTTTSTTIMITIITDALRMVLHAKPSVIIVIDHVWT